MMGALEESGTDYMPVFFLKPQITANLEWAEKQRINYNWDAYYRAKR